MIHNIEWKWPLFTVHSDIQRIELYSIIHSKSYLKTGANNNNKIKEDHNLQFSAILLIPLV